MEHVGERFARALADKDSAGLKALLRPDVDFRAMTPNRFWESNDVDEIVDETILGTWFEPGRRITELVAFETGSIGSLERVAYRFEVDRPDGRFTIEQQAYYETDGATIAWMRLMCTGFLPLSSSESTGSSHPAFTEAAPVPVEEAEDPRAHPPLRPYWSVATTAWVRLTKPSPHREPTSHGESTRSQASRPTGMPTLRACLRCPALGRGP
jgi:hypothetical protein